MDSRKKAATVLDDIKIHVKLKLSDLTPKSGHSKKSQYVDSRRSVPWPRSPPDPSHVHAAV